MADRRENTRIYENFITIKRDNPDKTVQLTRGIITVDGGEVDRRDSTRNFRDQFGI